MDKWKKGSTDETMVRCWCWTTSEAGRVDNGWRNENVPYPHYYSCSQQTNPDSVAAKLLFELADNPHLNGNEYVVQLAISAALHCRRQAARV